MTDLEQFLKGLVKETNEILLMWDANNNPGSIRSRMPKLLHDIGMIDLHAYFHGMEGEPNTYIRGKCRIDFMHGTPKLLQVVTATGFETFRDSVVSDHRGAFVICGCQSGTVALRPGSVSGIHGISTVKQQGS